MLAYCWGAQAFISDSVINFASAVQEQKNMLSPEAAAELISQLRDEIAKTLPEPLATAYSQEVKSLDDSKNAGERMSADDYERLKSTVCAWTCKRADSCSVPPLEDAIKAEINRLLGPGGTVGHGPAVRKLEHYWQHQHQAESGFAKDLEDTKRKLAKSYSESTANLAKDQILDKLVKCLYPQAQEKYLKLAQPQSGNKADQLVRFLQSEIRKEAIAVKVDDIKRTMVSEAKSIDDILCVLQYCWDPAFGVRVASKRSTSNTMS